MTMMTNQLPHSIDLDLSEFDSERNFNQSFNQRYRPNDVRSAENSSWLERGKHFTYYFILLLMLFPIIFILVGMIYRRQCSIDSHLTLFLSVFGVLILLNVFVYTILGSTFLTCEIFAFRALAHRFLCLVLRQLRSLSSNRNASLLIGTIFNAFVGVLLLIWWIMGIVSIASRSIEERTRSFRRWTDLVDWVHLVGASRGRCKIDILSSDCLLDSFTGESLRFNRLCGSDLHGK